MSDPNTTPETEHADESASVDETVARANEGLADAEAAGRDAVAEPAPEPAVVPVETVTEPAPADAVPAEPVVVEETVVEEVPPAEPVGAEPATAEPVIAADALVVDEIVIEDDVAAQPVTEPAPAERAPWNDYATDETPAASAVPAETFVAAAAAQPIFVQAPEAPRPRGNRGTAGAIGLLAAVAFAVLTFGIQFAAAFVLGTVDGAGAADFAVALATSWVFWVPVVAFFIGFWFLGALLNRARWGHWVIWGLLVAVVAYGGYILGVLFEAPFWQLTARQGADLLADSWFSPFAIVAFVVAREVTIWFGAWVAARGRKVTEANAQAQAEYERTLEAGPQLYQQ